MKPWELFQGGTDAQPAGPWTAYQPQEAPTSEPEPFRAPDMQVAALSPAADPEPEVPTPVAPKPQRKAGGIDDIVTAAADEYGIDPGYFRRIAKIESGLNPRARTGSYRGLFQMGPDEWSRYGAGGDIYDPAQNARAAAQKMRDEQDAFAAQFGRNPEPYELYLIHQQGAAGYAAHASNPNAPAWINMAGTGEGRQKGERWAKQAIWGNIPDSDKRRFGSVDNVSSRDFAEIWRRRVEGQSASDFENGDIVQKILSAPPEERQNILDAEIADILGVPLDLRGKPGDIGLVKPLPTGSESPPVPRARPAAAPQPQRPPWEQYAGQQQESPAPAAPQRPPWEAYKEQSDLAAKAEAGQDELGLPFLTSDAQQKALASGKAGIFDTAGNIGKQLYDAALYHLPAAVAATWEGSDPYAERDWADLLVERSRAQAKKRRKDGGEGAVNEGVSSLGPSVAFSIPATIGGLATGLGAGAVGTLAGGPAGPITGPIAGWTSGTLASGAIAYRQSVNQFVRDLRDMVDETRSKQGQPPISDDEFRKKADELAPLVREYGLWEAVPEAAGNVLGLGIVTAPVKSAIGRIFGKTIATRFATKAASLYGAELATETVTQQGQSNVEAGAKEAVTGRLQPRRSWVSASDLGASFKEVAIPTLLQTTLFGAAAKGGHMLVEKVKRGSLTRDQYDALMELNDQVERGQFDPEGAQREAVRLLSPNPGEEVRPRSEKAVPPVDVGEAPPAPQPLPAPAEPSAAAAGVEPAPVSPSSTPQSPVPAAPAAPISPRQADIPAQDRATLRAYGYTPEQVAAMSPAARAAELDAATEAGITATPQQVAAEQQSVAVQPASQAPNPPETAASPPAAKVSPDQPTAEPIKDLIAQANDLAAPDNPRRSVWLPKASLEQIQTDPAAAKHVLGAGVPVENFDGQGGTLVAKDQATADLAIGTRDAGLRQLKNPEDRVAFMQGLIGSFTGAGQGKPVDTAAVVQQVTPDGAVARETAVTEQQIPQAEEHLAMPGREVRTVTPEAALIRRQEEIGAERARETGVPGTRGAPVEAASADDIAAAGAVAEQPKSQAQADAGNYQKGHLKFAESSPLAGYRISIETAKGEPRQKLDENGDVVWREEAIPAHYGHFVDVPARSSDGEHPDVIVGDDPTSNRAFVINQYNPQTKRFDETKSVVAVRTVEQATALYDGMFSDGSGPSRRRSIIEMSAERLKELLDGEHDFTKPVHRQANDQAAGPSAQNELISDSNIHPQDIIKPEISVDDARKSFELAKAKARALQNRLDKIDERLDRPREKGRNALDQERIDKNRKTLERIARSMRKKVAAAFDAIDDARDALKRAQSEAKVVRERPQRQETPPAPAASATQSARQPPSVPAEPGAPAGEMPDIPDFLKRAQEPNHAEEPNQGTQPTEAAGRAEVPVSAESRENAGAGQEEAAVAERPTPKSFWSYQSSEPTPSLEEAIAAGAIASSTTEKEWDRLSPGFKREIVGSKRKRQAAEEQLAGRSKAPSPGPSDSGPADKPLMVEAGMQLRSKSGRELAPVPKIDTTTEGRTQNTLKRMDRWLADEARKEAEATQNDYLQTLTKALDPKNFSQSDRDSANEIVFGDRNGPTKANIIDQGVSKAIDEKSGKAEQPAKSDHPAKDRPKNGAVARLNKMAKRLVGKDKAEWVKAAPMLRRLVAEVEAAAGETALTKSTKASLERLGEFELSESDAQDEKEPGKKEPPAEKLQDVGEKIGGARKDAWGGRGIGADDLKDMTGAERDRHVTKENVWPRPDYAALVDGGLDRTVAYGVKRIYDRIATKPSRSYGSRSESNDDLQLRYISIVRAMREEIEKIKTIDDLRNLQSVLNEKIGGNARQWGTDSWGPVLRTGPRGRYIFDHPAEWSYLDARAAERALKEGWPNSAPWQRLFKVYERDIYGKSAEGKFTSIGKEWIATRKNGATVGGTFKTKEEAEQAAQAAYEKMGGTEGQGEWPDRPHLDRVERAGPDYRGDQDVTGDSFLNDFGFRAVEFGNWVAGDERQKVVNLGYDALQDLARITGIPATAIALDGDMAVAFGARGRGGRAAAHYEADRRVVNMTKLTGAGSLAHEWMHALDHYLGEIEQAKRTGTAAYSRAAVWASGYREVPRSSTFSGNNAATRLKGLPKKLQVATNALMDTLMFKEDVSALEKQIEQAYQSQDGWRQALAQGREKKRAAQQIGVWQQHIASLERQIAAGGGRRIETSFYKQAQKLSGKSGKDGYWARPLEMLARAFEAYVYDKLTAEGLTSDYLVHSVEDGRYAGPAFRGDPYPSGDERQAINLAFDKFFRGLQTVEGKRGRSKVVGAEGEPEAVEVLRIRKPEPQTTHQQEAAAVEQSTENTEFGKPTEEGAASKDAEPAAAEAKPPAPSRDIPGESRDISGENSSAKTAERTESRDIEPAPLSTKQKRSLPDLFASHLAAGNRFDTIVAARKFAKEAGFDLDNKAIEEALEAGVVDAARGIVATKGSATPMIFVDLVDLYRRQPRLATRTGTSVTNQAYSTPVPLAYVASRLAGVADAQVVYEPTAGNGALLIEADPKTQKIIANEIDPDRAAALKAQGFRATEQDASSPTQGAVIAAAEPADAVIMNPPFGAVREGGHSKEFTTTDGWTTSQIDHAIALNSLQALGDGGKAVLILGGVNAQDIAERRAGYRSKAKREFYFRLYQNYNVVDHFTVDGSLYERQGAAWPVDVVVIKGRGKSELQLPAAAPPPILQSWDEVGTKLDAGPDTAAGRRDRRPDRSAAQPVERPVLGDEGGIERPASGRTAELLGERPDETRGIRGGAEGQPADLRGGAGHDGGLPPAAERDRRRPGEPSPAHARKPRLAQTANAAGQVSYVSSSTRGRALGTLVPANMASATRDALDRIEARTGSVDRLVSDRLGYPEKDIGKYFTAEQVDAISLAIDNVERGAGMIIGDQGGIGKGRVAAAMLRYAMRNGMIPVFVTEAPDLYGDMVRDMNDIGLPDMLGREPRIFMTNVRETVPLDEAALTWKKEADQARVDGKPIPKREGKFLTSGSKVRQDADMREIVDRTGKFDAVFTTYKQMDTVKGATTARRNFLLAISDKALFVTDESHNAGGSGQGGWKIKDATPNRAQFVRDLVRQAKGVVYSSATYAKRPEVMDLYVRTDMGKAVDNPEDLPDLISRGGVPMQQVVASMLSEAGQYVRRERSMEGVSYAMEPAPVDAGTYRAFSNAVRTIFQFDQQVEEIRGQIAKDFLDSQGKAKARDTGIGGASATSIVFSSIMHNIVNQMLLGIKADQVANRAIAAHAKGEKPVITVSNTMESFISDYAASEGIPQNGEIGISFKDVLARYLRRTLRITTKDANGNKGHIQIPVAHLPTELQRQYRDILDQINDGDYGALPVSPIDWMRRRLTGAGLRVAEITGRQTMIDYSSDPPRYVVRPKREIGPAGKRGSIAAFNRGDLDALIINRSGSTGVSMHAAEGFKDKKPRRMIIAQPEGNIDTQMQMLWRIDRTGQVHKPAYSQIAAEIPAEARPAAVLMKKMASLNANTTGARKSVFTAEALDFLNEYGDKVVGEIMAEDPQLNAYLGYPVTVNESGKLDVADAARKVTGRLVLLDPDEQSAVLDRIQNAYVEEIRQRDAMGENALEAKTVDLQARTLETTPLRERRGDGPFLDAANIEKVSVKSPGRAMAPSEVIDRVVDAIKAKRPGGDGLEALPQLRSEADQWIRNKISDIRVLAAKWIKDDVANRPESSRQKVQEMHTANLQRWIATAHLAYPGATVRLGMASGDLDGVVIAIERKRKSQNPVALSAWDVTIAVPDSQRQLTFSMSRLFPTGFAKPEEEVGASIVRSNNAPTDLAAQFEEARKEGRETRHIVTGNILAGYDAMSGLGQIVNYTTEGGDLRPGILLPRGFNQQKFMDTRAVRFTSVDQVAAFMDRSPAEIKSTDGFVALRKERGHWVIDTAAGRATGGRYYTEPAVQHALGGADFVRRGPVMQVALSRDRFVATVAAMRQIGAVFETRSDQDIAQQAMVEIGEAPKGALATIRASMRPDELPDNSWLNAASKRQVEIIYGEVTGTAKTFKNKRAAVEAVRAIRDAGAVQEAEAGAVLRAQAAADGFDTSQDLWHGTTRGPFTRFKESIQHDDVLGPGSYLSRHRAGAEVYGTEGTVLGPFWARGNIVGPDTVVPFHFNSDGSVKNRAKAIHVLGWLRHNLITGRREEWGKDLSPAQYAREFWKRRGIDGYDSGGGHEVAIYDPANIRAGFELPGLATGSAGLASISDSAGTKARETGPSAFQGQEQPIDRIREAVHARMAELGPKRMEELRGEVREIVARVAGSNTNLQFFGAIPSDQTNLAAWGKAAGEVSTSGGFYSPVDDIIALAIADPAYAGMERTGAYHEAYHRVEYQLQNERERRLMGSPAETARLRRVLQDQFGFSKKKTDGMYGYEVRAVTFEAYAQAREAGADGVGFSLHIGIRRVFERIYQVLRRIRNWWKGLGYETAEDIYKRAYEGEFAKREPNPLVGPEEFIASRATARENAPVFYSAVTRAIENAKQIKAAADQWLGMLRNAPGIKPEEMDWLGVEPWLREQKGAVTKEELLDYVRANQVEVREVDKGENAEVERRLADMDAEITRLERAGDPRWRELSQERGNLLRQAPTETKYGSYTLPGGKNYRELLLTLPSKTSERPRGFGSTEEAQAWHAADLQNFHSSHWKEPNILAHIRFDDRTIDGKRTLHIAEVQSDWGQTLRKLRKPDSNPSSIPSMPFGTTWPELAMKRMIRHAAENGYDAVSWDAGETQADRYDLSKHINSIGYEHRGYLTNVTVWDKRDRNILTNQSADADWLENHLGKEIAKKIVNGEGRKEGPYTYLEDLDLKVGGEGMLRFYDDQLPRVANKLAKKYGTRVAPSILKVPPDEKAFREAQRSGDSAAIADAVADRDMPVHFLPITPALRDAAVQKGFPMFTIRTAPPRRTTAGAGLTLPTESVRAALTDPAMSRSERLSAAIDAALLNPSRALWDKFIDLTRFQRAAELAGGEATPENLDVRLAATLYPGRAGERMKDATHHLFRPLYDEMTRRGISRDELHEYLYARHAPERNEKIREIDPGNDAGSGMTDDEAADIMSGFSDRRADFEAVADRVDQITAHNRALMEREGLENPETLDRWREAYLFYVPLKGAETSESEQFGSPPLGQGFDVRRPESRRALGRFSRAGDILANILGQTQRTIIRAEKNRVGKTFLRFAQANPSPFYKIGLAERSRRINPETGLVELVTKVANSEAPKVFAVKVGGETYHVQIEHEGLLTALKNLGIERLPALFRAIGAFTRTYAAFQTAKNPEFVVTNLLRDLADAGLNLTAEQQSGFKRAFAKRILSGNALLGAALGEIKETDTALGRAVQTRDPEIARLYDEWRKEGGKISSFGYRDLQSIQRDIERELARRTESRAKTVAMAPLRTVDPFNGYVVKLFEALSDITESTTRLAIYVAARDIGLSKAQAAKAARSITVDFNMKGSQGHWFQALYAFANPAIQGTVNLVRRLRRSKAMRRAALGVAGTGFLLTLWNLWAAPDDDDKKNLYAKRPYWEREKNFVIYLPGRRDALKIPMGYALQPFFMMGEEAAMAMMGKTKPTEALGNWLGTTVKAFNPLGSDGSIFSLRTWVEMLSPTIIDPIVELSTNKNWLGYNIHPSEGPWSRGKPKSEQSKASTNPMAIDAARWINRATGGNTFQPGAVDLYPDDLEYAWNFALGGFGRFIGNNWGLARDLMDGAETPVERIPFVRRFAIPADSMSVERNEFYQANQDVQQKREALRDARKALAAGKNQQDARSAIAELNSFARLDHVFDAANSRLKKLREEEKEIRNSDAMSRADRQRQLDANKKSQMEIMRRARMKYDELQDKSKQQGEWWRARTRQILENVQH